MGFIITFADDEPVSTTTATEQATNPHHARFLADLIQPFQREEIKELCARLGVDPQAEAAAMFGDDVDFYQLSCRSARGLGMALQNRARGMAA